MFAYVKALKGAHQDETKIVNTSRLHNFQKDKHRKNLKYMLKSGKIENPTNDTPVVILLLADTRQKLQTLIDDETNRLKSVPLKHLVTASSLSSSSDSEANLDKRLAIENKITKTKSLNDKELESAVKDKLAKFKNNAPAISPKDKSLSAKENEDNSITVKHPRRPFLDVLNTQNDSTVTEINVEQSGISGESSNSKSHHARHSGSNSIYEDTANSSNRSTLQMENNGKHLKAHNPNSKDERSTKGLKNHTQEGSKKATHQNKVTIKGVDTVITLHKKVEDLVKINDNLKTKVETLSKENSELKKEKDNYKKKYTQTFTQYEKVQKLNQELQVTIIEHTKEKNDMFQKILAAQSSVGMELNFPAIGYLKTT